MRYKIGDVARILGISPDLIRYYEEKGVVSPQKDPNNNYRYYDAWDINFLIDCLWYKNFGFGIDQVAKMVSSSSYDMLLDKLKVKEEEIVASIRHQQLLLYRIRKYYDSLVNLRSCVGVCDVRESKEFVRYLNRYNTEYDNRRDLQKLSREWLKYMPFTKRYFEVPEDDLFGDGDDYAWGFSLGKKYVDEFHITVKPPLVLQSARLCIHSAFKSVGRDNFTARHLDFMVSYAEQHGFEPDGCAFGNLACSVIEDNKITGFFEVWLPVRQAERNE